MNPQSSGFGLTFLYQHRGKDIFPVMADRNVDVCRGCAAIERMVQQYRLASICEPVVSELLPRRGMVRVECFIGRFLYCPAREYKSRRWPVVRGLPNGNKSRVSQRPRLQGFLWTEDARGESLRITPEQGSDAGDVHNVYTDSKYSHRSHRRGTRLECDQLKTSHVRESLL